VRVPLDARRTVQMVCADCVNLSAMRRLVTLRLSAFCFLLLPEASLEDFAVSDRV
jgi:hypothetical protein